MSDDESGGPTVFFFSGVRTHGDVRGCPRRILQRNGRDRWPHEHATTSGFPENRHKASLSTWDPSRDRSGKVVREGGGS